MTFRKLTQQEIETLESHGCTSNDWGSIEVADDFAIDNIRNAKITNCTICKDVTIRNVFGELRNLFLYDGVYIESVYSITCDGETSTGVGYKVKVMSETGGRPVAIYPTLTAEVAYMQAFYRHSALFTKVMDELVKNEVTANTGSTCIIGRNARIVNCGILSRLTITDGARLEGVSKLSNGVVGNAYVGPDVIAEDFIINDGATVTDASHLKGAFIGDGVTIAAATVHDSLIFSNSHIENSEVVASFLGPFSTSMHKSTLLIGGLFSFFNAGSGSNQSNHGYKLGPMHQGITLRGCKTGSDSYILWPAAIGAFTTILGRHYSHPDTRDFPFSLLLNDFQGRSILLPGAAAATVGLARDVDKWPKRYVPTYVSGSGEPMINFRWLTPFTIEACLRGKLRLEQHDTCTSDMGFVIADKAIDKGIRIYTLLIDRYVAETILAKIQSKISVNPQYGVGEIVESLRQVESVEAAGHEASGHWVDMGGMVAPKSVVEKLIDEVSHLDFISSFDFQLKLEEIAKGYSRYNWRWLQENLRELAGIEISQLSPAKVAEILQRGADAIEQLTLLWETDAAKEFDPERASLGFGIDAYENRQEILDDFARSRGSLAGNQFLAMNQRSTKEKANRMCMFAQVMSQQS